MTAKATDKTITLKNGQKIAIVKTKIITNKAYKKYFSCDFVCILTL
jgi:hypothetical protein